MYQAKKEGKNRYSVYQSQKEQHSYAILNQPSITKTFFDEAMVQFMADSVLDGMIGWYVKEGFPIYYINDNMLKLLGFEDEKTYREAVNGHFLETILAKDRLKTEQSIREQLQSRSFWYLFVFAIASIRLFGSVVRANESITAKNKMRFLCFV